MIGRQAGRQLNSALNSSEKGRIIYYTYSQDLVNVHIVINGKQPLMGVRKECFLRKISEPEKHLQWGPFYTKMLSEVTQ